jgi:hypothetical protein
MDHSVTVTLSVCHPSELPTNACNLRQQRMRSSRMLHRVALVRTEFRIASIIRVTRIGELGTTLVFLRSVLLLLVTVNIVPSSWILATLMMEVAPSSETSVLTKTT